MRIEDLAPLLLSALVAYNNSSVVSGPLSSLGLGRRASAAVSGAAMALGAALLGSVMRPPTGCARASVPEAWAYLSIAIPMLLSTAAGAPFSASMALIGFSAGVGFLRGGLSPAWAAGVAILWISSGFLVILISIITYSFALKKLSQALEPGLFVAVSRMVVIALSAASGLLFGANTLGFLSSLECHSRLWLVALGGLAASLPRGHMLEGLLRWFSVRHLSTLSIQLSTVVALSLATLLGLPLSHVYAITLSTLGYSVIGGLSPLSRRVLLRLLAVWLISTAAGAVVPVAAALLASVLS